MQGAQKSIWKCRLLSIVRADGKLYSFEPLAGRKERQIDLLLEILIGRILAAFCFDFHYGGAFVQPTEVDRNSLLLPEPQSPITGPESPRRGIGSRPL